MCRASPRASHRKGLTILTAALLLVVSSELGLRGVLMYGTWASQDQLIRLNQAQICATEPDGRAGSDGSHPPEHGPLCFVYLLAVKGLEPVLGRFASVQFVRRVWISSALVRDVLIRGVAARAPPLR
jgi:hypothetical protein